MPLSLISAVGFSFPWSGCHIHRHQRACIAPPAAVAAPPYRCSPTHLLIRNPSPHEQRHRNRRCWYPHGIILRQATTTRRVDQLIGQTGQESHLGSIRAFQRGNLPIASSITVEQHDGARLSRELPVSQQDKAECVRWTHGACWECRQPPMPPAGRG